MGKTLGAIAAAVVAVCACAADSADEGRTFPFPMNGYGPGKEARRPAGTDGFLAAKGDHFVDAKGKVHRFLGINLYGPAHLPEKAVAERTARELASWGFNAVRMLPQYVWELRADRTYAKGPDPELLDRFDYFFAKLRENGISATMNLHCSRTAGYRFKGFRQTIEQNKGIDNFDPTFIRHQKEWAKFVFEHVNPYTGLAYRDDPAVLSWEINNECSLAVSWFTWDLWEKMTPPFRDELSRQFSAWLKGRYGATARLRDAWRIASPAKPDLIPAETWRDGEAFKRIPWYTENRKGIEGKEKGYRFEAREGVVKANAATLQKFCVRGIPLETGEVYTVAFRVRSAKEGRVLVRSCQHGAPYAAQGIFREIATGPAWKDVKLSSSALLTDPDNRVQIAFVTRGEYEIAGLSVIRGGTVGLEADESIEAGTVRPSGTGSPTRAKDTADFIFETEDRYWKEMTDYLRIGLKARQPVNGGTLGYGAGYAQTHADFLDVHFYYGGLSNSWNPENWYGENRLMVKSLDDGATQYHFGSRVFGFPYTMSEANQLHQTATAADFFPILLSIAAFQDVSAIHAYTWTHAPDHRYGGTKWLEMHGNAKLLAHLPAARNMFIRGDVKSGMDEPVKLVYELGREEERAGISGSGFVDVLRRLGPDPLACVKAVTGLRYTDLGREDAAVTGVKAAPFGRSKGAVRRAVSSTGEIRWDATEKGREFFAVDAPRTKFLSQFGPAGTAHRFADGMEITLGDTLMGWAAVSFTEMDARTWLLAATGWQQPTGAVVRIYGEAKPLRPQDETAAANRLLTTMGAMGNVPFVCEGVRATVRLPVPAGATVSVTPLTGDGVPAGAPLAVRQADGFATFSLHERHRTVWYHVAFAPAKGRR